MSVSDFTHFDQVGSKLPSPFLLDTIWNMWSLMTAVEEK